MKELLLLLLVGQDLPVPQSDPLPNIVANDEEQGPSSSNEAAAADAAAVALPAEGGAASTPAAPPSSFVPTWTPEAANVVDLATLDQRVVALLRDKCADCHDRGDALPLIGDLSVLRTGDGATSIPFLNAAMPDQSYLLWKINPSAKGLIDGDTMPIDDALSSAEIALVRLWIKQSDRPAEVFRAAAPHAAAQAADVPAVAPTPTRGTELSSFSGTYGPTGPTTTTQGKRTLAMHVKHRFGPLLVEGSYLGFKAGTVVSLGLAYGVTDWLDAQARFSTLGGDFELGAKAVPLRQENGGPLSMGVLLSYDGMIDASIARRATFNLVGIASRMWARRIGTGFLLGYSTKTNHAPRQTVELNGIDYRLLDRRASAYVGVQTALYLGRQRRHAIEAEWLFPFPADGAPDPLHFHGGDTSPEFVPLGTISLGWSGRFGRHVFQVFATNNSAIHTNWWAPGPEFVTFKESLLLGFNLTRSWKL